MLMHFNELKADLRDGIRRIAAFLEIEIEDAAWPRIVDHCGFDFMQANGDANSRVLRHLFDGGMQSFIYKGTNERWRGELTAEDIRKYEDAAKAYLDPDCVRWLETGEASLLAQARAG